MKEKLKHVLFVMIVLMSIVRMNQRYMDYQGWTYQQMAIGEHMRKSDEIREGRNFVWIHLGGDDGFQRFYVMNGIAREVFGDEKRLFLRLKELHASYWYQEKLGENMLTDHYYNLADYELKNQELDGVILYHDSTISGLELLRLKFDEIFRKERFREKISALGYMDYIPGGGAIVNDRGMNTMWSKEAADIISRRIPVPFEKPKREFDFWGLLKQ